MLTMIIFYILPTDYRWYIKDSNNKEETIRSVLSGGIIYPELQWDYLKINITECTTVRYELGSI